MTEYDKQIIDGMHLAYYGETREQRDERIKKELTEKLLFEQNRKMALKLYFERKWKIVEIALFLSWDKDEVKKVVEEYSNS